ncbi:hypothetical protein DW892_08580 [Collinsella sp. AM40-7AC]|nr:hypothetical protein DW892_08580 [Collinsella sp. AM40-7AC]RHC29248.1 hypothetical protein DW850_07450 [Collinsella sp. AM36-4AA]RHJ25543.1 hypothetical protein DW136_06325 [Collinsella sp. AM12-1]
MTIRSMPRLFHANLFALGGARFFCSTYDLKPLLRGVFAFRPLPAALSLPALVRHLGMFLLCRQVGTLLC